MPIGITSPARNLFVFGSSGASATQDFLTRITPSPTDTYGISPTDIVYEDTNQQIYIAGTQYDFTYAVTEGFIIRTTDGDADRDIDLKIKGSTTNIDVTINALEYDSNLNIFVCGATEDFSSNTLPHVTKFNTNGNIVWSRTFQAGGSFNNVVYNDLCVDAYDNVYVCGNDGDIVVVSKYDQYGTCLWTKTYEDTNFTWIAFKASAIAINSKEELIVVGRVEAATKDKGFLFKMSTNGELLWSKTFEVTSEDYDAPILFLEDVYVDDSDQIYVVGYEEDNVTSDTRSFIMRMTREGNLMWQTRTNTAAFNIRFRDVSVDSLTGQSVVIGECNIGVNGFILLQRYSTFGKLIWSRKISSPNNRGVFANLYADPSYIYIAYADESSVASDPESFLFGKVSVTGSGLGAFEYADGQTTQDYVIETVAVETNTLYDGSMRMDVSDFQTYPHSAINVMFGDISGGNMIYSDKKPVHDDVTNDITSNSLTGTNVASHVLAEDIVRDNNLLLNYDFGNEFTYDRAENLANNSETFENWTANGSRATITPNQIVAPDGSLTADMIEDFDTSNGFHNLYQYITITATETYTASLYVKAGTSDWVNFYFDDTNVSFQFSTETISIDPISGNLGGTSGAPPATAGFDNVGNGWYRLYLKDVYAFSGSRPFGIWTGANSQSYNPSYVGDPQYNFYIWGAQVEKGSTPGRYIKTSGLSINAPTTFKNLSSSSYSGTLDGATFVNNYIDTGSSTGRLVVTDDGGLQEGNNFSYEAWVWYDNTTQTNSFPRIYERSASLMHFTQDPANTDVYFNINTGSGTRQAAVTTGSNIPAPNAWNHYVGTYDGQNQILYINGVEAANTNHGSVVSPNTVTNDLYIGDNGTGGGRIMDGRIGEFRRYTRTLSSTEVSQNFNATRAKYGV